MTIYDLKKYEDRRIKFFYRGKYRDFILAAVMDKEPCKCTFDSTEHKTKHLINGQYQSKFGDFRLNYVYGNNKKREWNGFWTNKIENIKINKIDEEY